MTIQAPTRAEYLERLRDLLPDREGARIVQEVDLLIQDRMEAEQAADAASPAAAEQRAIAALGPAERLAADLASPPVAVDLATRRTFTRLLAVTFAAHLLLAIVLTVAGLSGPAVPGLLAPLPLTPAAALLSSVFAILLIDTGGLFLLFALLGRGKAPARFPAISLRTAANRRDALAALVLLALVALILHPFRDAIFAVRDGDRLVPILSPALVDLLPLVDGALGLLALRQVAILLAGREHVAGVAADALASLALAVVLVLAATRSTLVHLPTAALGHRAADMLEDLTTRVLLLVFLGAALFLTVRFVKRALRLRQLLVAG